MRRSNPGTRYTSGSPGRAVSSQYWAGQMPSDFGTSSSSSYIYSVCANYIAADEQPQVTLIGNPYMYTARRYDIETGLYYYRARYYNPYIGRFTQLDPARQGMNWYAYCGNNSINCIDPTGLIAIAFYDPKFEKYYRDSNGKFRSTINWDGVYLMESAAKNLFDKNAFPMKSGDDVLDKLAELKKAGIEITEVYFYDHGGSDNSLKGNLIYFCEFGDEEIKIDRGHRGFYKKLGNLVPKDCVLHFRQCIVGKAVYALALYTNRTVTGCTGQIFYDGLKNDDKIYEFRGDLMQAIPGGKVTPLWQYQIKKIVGYQSIQMEVMLKGGLRTRTYQIPIYQKIINNIQYEGY